MPTHWTPDTLPSLSGLTALVTGANSGIGYEAALTLAGKGATVFLGVRDPAKGSSARQQILAAHPQAQVEVLPLDLANQASIRQAAAAFLARDLPLDLLINNAGVMAIPFTRTVDGFEAQFGTNHLGHFALTGLLLPALRQAASARVVTVSSLNHNYGTIQFDNLDGSQKYTPFGAYNQSKLANVLFAYELQRRLDAAQIHLSSIACHPGYANTNLQYAGPRLSHSRLSETFWRVMNNVFAQSAQMGALPLLFAALSPDVRGGEFAGPLGPGGARGYPGVYPSNPRSYDLDVARRLWQVSEELTGLHYPPGL